MGRDGGARRKETAAGEGNQVQEEPRRLQQQRHRRRRESKTRTVRSNLLPPPGGGEPDVTAKGAPHRWRRNQGSSQYLADNRLKTTKYTVLSFLPKNLFEQFHRLANVYFVLIALFNFVPVLNAFQPELALAPVLFILAVTAIKDLWEDYSRHRSDHEINHMDCLVYCRDEKKFVNRYWKEVRVGDFVQLRCNEIIPADILLLSSSDPDGLCHIETANLDGETNLKQRQVVREFLELPVMQKFLHDHVDLQVSALYALQVHCYNNNFPKGMLLRFFVHFYDMEIIEEEAFLAWKEDITQEFPGKGKALFQVNQWLTWLETAEEEESEEEAD